MNDTVPQPVAVNVCGSPLGPEVVLGHYWAKTSSSPTALIKVGKGGSSILTDWRSPSIVTNDGGNVGEYYNKLENRIQSLDLNPESVHPDCVSQDCHWGAFIWFQGENDSFNQENAELYNQYLKYLVADVRAEIGAPELPVIIVQIGAWAQSLSYGKVVEAAQRAFVDGDLNATFVETGDLSGFYHYDPASQFIIGERVGKALKSML